MVNAKFEEKGLTCRIDHRSYERQGLDLLPTVHEGVAVRQMEAKGIPTDKGDLNRWIKKANNILRDIRKKIAGLTDWIKAIKEELSKPQAPTLAALLTDYYEGRNAGAWSRNARIGNLKGFAEAINFLTERGIATLEDLETHIAAQSERTEAQGHVWKCRVSNENKAREVEQRYHVSAKQLTSDGLLMKIISSSHPDIECWPCEASLEDAYIYLSNIKT